MWRLWVCVGAVVWIATISASAAINYLAWHDFGRSAGEAQVFAILGVSADAWKAIGPLFFVNLWHRKKWASAGVAGLVWIACFAVAVSSALGVAAQNRTATTSGREMTRLSYDAAQAELAELSARRKVISETRGTRELQALIGAELAKPTERGTVQAVSASCARDHPLSRAVCAEVARLKISLAQAQEGERIDDRIRDLRRKVEDLRERGALRDSDPQAQLIARLAFGLVPIDAVGLVLILLLVGMIEVISAFAPVVLHEYVLTQLAPQNRVQIGKTALGDSARHDQPDVYKYLLANILPDRNGVVTVEELVVNFREWWADHSNVLAPDHELVAALDVLCDAELSGHVNRIGEKYVGFRIAS